MDWTRTKTILIIALILTNGVLIFSLYGDRIGADNLDEQKYKRLEEVISFLSQKRSILQVIFLPVIYTCLMFNSHMKCMKTRN